MSEATTPKNLSEIAQDIVDRLSANTLKLPASPEVILQINTLMNDETKGMVDIAEAIASHQTLAARILQVVNSPALRPAKPVTRLHEALVILGMALVRNLAISIAIRDMFRSNNFELKVLLEETWHHSIEVGALSNLLTAALEDRRYDPSTALVIGLLHSIGCLPIIDYFEQAKLPVTMYHDVAEELAPLLSTYLLKQWGLPQSFSDAITGQPGMYSEILKYVHGYLEEADIENPLIPIEEFEKTVNDNHDKYHGLVSVFH